MACFRRTVRAAVRDIKRDDSIFEILGGRGAWSWTKKKKGEGEQEVIVEEVGEAGRAMIHCPAGELVRSASWRRD